MVPCPAVIWKQVEVLLPVHGGCPSTPSPSVPRLLAERQYCNLHRCVCQQNTMCTAIAGAWEMSPLNLSAAVATVAVAPLLFIPSLRQLSHLSWMGFVSTLVVMLAVCAAAAADPHRTAAPLQAHPVNSSILVICGFVYMRVTTLASRAAYSTAFLHGSTADGRCCFSLACFLHCSRRQATTGCSGASFQHLASLRCRCPGTPACRQYAPPWRSRTVLGAC